MCQYGGSRSTATIFESAVRTDLYMSIYVHIRLKTFSYLAARELKETQRSGELPKSKAIDNFMK